MRAAIYERTGPAREVIRIEDVARPDPGPGEVRIKVETSGVNPSDVKSRAGLRSKILPFPRITPHSDGAGVIDAVGAGVPRERIGERVWTWNAAWQRPFGTAAEYVALPSIQAVALPPQVDVAAAACFGIPALTALRAVEIDGGVNGKSVLVAGGAGAVGSYAIQFARVAGARTVVATVSSDEKAAHARSVGADVVIDYKRDDVAARVNEATAGRGVDRVIEVDLAGNVGLDLQVVGAGGDIVVYGSNAAEIAIPFFPAILKNVALRFFIVYNLAPEVRAQTVERLTALLRDGKLVHSIAARVPLSRIAEAHELVESGRAIGNVVVDIGGEQEA